MTTQVPDSVEQSVVKVVAVDAGLGIISNGYIFTAAHCISIDFEGGIALGGRLQECSTLDGQDFFSDIMFVDAVSDLAVLCCPDSQGAIRLAEKYDQAIDGRGVDLYRGEMPSLETANSEVEFNLDEPRRFVRPEPMSVLIRNKTGWVDGKASNPVNGRLRIEASKQIESGASGGPIIDVANNQLVAINSVYDTVREESHNNCGGLQPLITHALPVWLAKQLRLGIPRTEVLEARKMK